MTSDSDDVVETAKKKPKGSIDPPRAPEDVPAERAHPTGEEQAEQNRAEDPPA